MIKSHENLLTNTVIKRIEDVGDKKERAKFKLGVWKEILKKLASIQEQKKLAMADEFTMTKAEISETAKKINDLQEEIEKVFAQKTISKEELRKLEIRLKSLEVILPSSDSKKN